MSSPSKTHTKTYPRLELVIMQFRRLIRRCAVEVTEEYIEKVCSALREGWVQTVLIYGLDENGHSHVEASLHVDWNEHNRQISRGEITVSVDPKLWRDDLAVEIEEMIRIFNDARVSESLTTEWRIKLSDRVTNNKVLKKEVYEALNLIDRPAIKWASPVDADDTMHVDSLSELVARIRFSG